MSHRIGNHTCHTVIIAPLLLQPAPHTGNREPPHVRVHRDRTDFGNYASTRSNLFPGRNTHFSPVRRWSKKPIAFLSICAAHVPLLLAKRPSKRISTTSVRNS